MADVGEYKEGEEFKKEAEELMTAYKYMDKIRSNGEKPYIEINLRWCNLVCRDMRDREIIPIENALEILAKQAEKSR